MPQFQEVFIAEKPSLAKGIAETLAKVRGVRAEKRNADGYWAVGDSAVTWLIGHLYDTAEPGAYKEEWQSRNLSSLPIEIPFAEWKLVIAEEKKKPGDDREPFDKKGHIRKVNAILKQAKAIVNCGDAAREGQLLVDEVILEAGIDAFAPNVKRLWVKSLAEKDMIAALSGLFPNADKRTLYNSAVSRQRADWLHGMNYSRLYSALAKRAGVDANVQVGRVMTPTLRLVVDRDRERIRFKPTNHYLPRVRFRHEGGVFQAAWQIPADGDGLDSEGRLIDKAVAEAVARKVDGKAGRISSYKAELKTKGAPLPFSLSALQTECGAKFQLTADEVLQVAQSLYETHKATTYPRSDSRHLPTAILKDEAPSIMRALQGIDELGDAAGKADMAIRSAAWDDGKVSDHHGIIPTTECGPGKLAAMSDVERKVFLLIARHFVAQFHPSFKYKATAVEVTCEGERFRANGRVVSDQGWKVVFGAGEADDEDDKDEEAAQTLPAMAQGDAVTAQGSEISSMTTSPPPAFTDGSLIQAMVNVHRFETNPELKKRLKENAGIGTEATRAPTIQKLLGVNKQGKVLVKNPLLERKGKTGLVSTEFGRSIIDMLPEDLRSVGMTALWEGLLSQVEKGAMEPDAFLERMARSIAERVEAAKSGEVTVTLKGVSGGPRPIEGHGETCPKCGKGVLMTREITSKKDGKKYKLLACSHYPDCDYNRWPQPKVDPLPGHGKDCPACGKGKLLTREITSKKDGKKHKLLACSNYPECKHGEWPERPQVDPLPGDGKACPKCGNPMKTYVVSKEGPNKGKRFLGCTDPKRECKTFEFPEPDVAPIAGHGEPCAKCGKGTMRTKQINAKSGQTYVVLACTAYPACDNTVWPERKVADPLPGDGKTCPECAKGTLRTKEFKKDGETKRFLSCSNYPGCKHAEWPDRGTGGGKEKASGGKAGAGRR